jgi:hypothetical protein
MRITITSDWLTEIARLERDDEGFLPAYNPRWLVRRLEVTPLSSCRGPGLYFVPHHALVVEPADWAWARFSDQSVSAFNWAVQPPPKEEAAPRREPPGAAGVSIALFEKAA